MLVLGETGPLADPRTLRGLSVRLAARSDVKAAADRFPPARKKLHYHSCVCGSDFQCGVDILPTTTSRTRCRWWDESICPACFESAVNAVGGDELRETLESMVRCADGDPLLSHRARERLKSLDAT